MISAARGQNHWLKLCEMCGLRVFRYGGSARRRRVLAAAESANHGRFLCWAGSTLPLLISNRDAAAERPGILFCLIYREYIYLTYYSPHGCAAIITLLYSDELALRTGRCNVPYGIHHCLPDRPRACSIEA